MQHSLRESQLQRYPKIMTSWVTKETDTRELNRARA